MLVVLYAILMKAVDSEYIAHIHTLNYCLNASENCDGLLNIDGYGAASTNKEVESTIDIVMVPESFYISSPHLLTLLSFPFLRPRQPSLPTVLNAQTHNELCVSCVHVD